MDPMTQPEPPIARICCFCTPQHVMAIGTLPGSHGACPIAMARLAAEWGFADTDTEALQP